MFDRAIFVRLLVAVAVVLPPLFFFQVTTTNSERDARVEALAHTQAELAAEKIDRTVAECDQFNQVRDLQIRTSEALIRTAAEAPPEFLSDRDRLLLTQFVQQAERDVEQAVVAKDCTVEGLHLQVLEAIVRDDSTK